MSSTRERLLTGLPVTDRRQEIAGVTTAVLEGGEGPSMLLLHGPGEFAGSWVPVLANLVRSHHVIAPDLPGHGASQPVEPGAGQVLGWLGELIERTCAAPPVLVGRIVGGAIGARFAIEHPSRLARLVLVDTLGLVPFEPDPRFALAMHRYLAQPSARSFERFMEFCAFDVDSARERLGARWEPLASYAVERASTASVQAAMGGLIGEFAAPIATDLLARIAVPTALIWGREDMATPVAAAEAAAARYGWPLHVIADAGDDPPFDQPAAFLDALRVILDAPVGAAVS